VVVLKQILNLIPRGMINRHALETGVEAKARSFTVLSHLSAMLRPFAKSNFRKAEPVGVECKA